MKKHKKKKTASGRMQPDNEKNIMILRELSEMYTKELIRQSHRNDAASCAIQHIKVFREQALRENLADFGEPCQRCTHSNECDFNWLSILSSLVDQSTIKISMVD